MKRVISIVEDEKDINNLVAQYLRKEGYEVHSYYTYEEASAHVADDDVHLWILDIMLDDKSGFDLIEEIRLQGPETPVIFMSARDKEFDRIIGLEKGCDDYITKPFKLGVLVSRINALLRRANSFQTADTELQSNGIKVLLLQGQVFKNGELLDLTAAEYKLLCLFMRNPSMVLTKGQILDKLWDCDGNYIDSSTLTVYMRRLRMKIEDNPSEPQMLLTVRGMGYKWNIIG